MKPYKKAIQILFFGLFFSNIVYAQLTDSTIKAKITLVQKRTKNSKAIAAISVTFINTSDKDIYVPGIFSISRTYPQGGKIRFYRKVGNIYVSDGNSGVSIPDTSYKNSGVFANPISGSRNEIIDKYEYISKEKEQQQNKIIEEFEKSSTSNHKLPAAALKPLFLKAHEQYEMYLIKDCDQLVNIPNEYMISYHLAYSLSNQSAYPDRINSYLKFIPVDIIASVLYTKVEP